MVNEQECIKILNDSEYKFTHDEMLLIRNFLTTLAQIEFDLYKERQMNSNKNACNSIHEGKYRRAS